MNSNKFTRQLVHQMNTAETSHKKYTNIVFVRKVNVNHKGAQIIRTKQKEMILSRVTLKGVLKPRLNRLKTRAIIK